MNHIQVATLSKVLRKVADRLEGDWILIGGSVLVAIDKEYRATVDIDLIGSLATQNAQTVELMKIAQEAGLPPETINQAGALFLDRMKPTKDDLILLLEGKKGSVFRPNLDLFVRLKIERFLESDLSDCLQYLRSERKNNSEKDLARIKKHVQKKAKESTSPDRTDRLKRLILAI